MLDYLISGGTVVDGTGAPARRADGGVRAGRVVAVGEVDEPAARVLDAEGLVVAPGFVDPHTHYDAQLHWDPLATPSNVHGVTTVIGGNTGFTLAPLEPADADYTRRMMAQVEGMPLAALEEGVDWSWRTFAEYLGALEGRIGVNAGFLVGHCAVRRFVMGPAAVGKQAGPDELAAMVRVLDESIEAGGLGFSTTLARTHSDGGGQPVPSRHATHEEVLALSEAVGRHPGTSLEAIVDGCLDLFSEDEIALLAQMSSRAGRPLNWNVLTIDSAVPERVPHQLEASALADRTGGRVVALTMPVQVPMNMSFLTYCALRQLPGWGEILTLPVPERIQRLSDPATRAAMAAGAQRPEAGVFRRLANWATYVIGDTYSPANRGLKGRTVASIAAERHVEPFTALLDVVVADELRTILWPTPPDDDPDSWRMRREAWGDDHVLLGGSDAGAHLDRMCGAPYTTRFLADCLRGRQLVPLERAVALLSDVPARLFGLRDRGRLTEGAFADLVVFDPGSVGSQEPTLVADLPGGAQRLTAGSVGVARVLVNGVETVVDGVATGAAPGTLLRSGRDTQTVATA
jgi:N-acyl-D-aspartate/D-glutamate deacylase